MRLEKKRETCDFTQNEKMVDLEKNLSKLEPIEKVDFKSFDMEVKTIAAIINDIENSKRDL